MNIQQIVISYVERWGAKGTYHIPKLSDCLDFMATEIGEAMDARLRRDTNYIRNTPKPKPTDRELGIEIFDAIMMGCIALSLLNLDLEDIANEKLQMMDEKRG